MGDKRVSGSKQDNAERERRDREIQRMWNEEGLNAKQISERFGWATNDVTQIIYRRRKQGWSFNQRRSHLVKTKAAATKASNAALRASSLKAPLEATTPYRCRRKPNGKIVVENRFTDEKHGVFSNTLSARRTADRMNAEHAKAQQGLTSQGSGR